MSQFSAAVAAGVIANVAFVLLIVVDFLCKIRRTSPRQDVRFLGSSAIVLLLLASFMPATVRATQGTPIRPRLSEAGPEGQDEISEGQEPELADAVEELSLVEIVESPIVSTLLTLLAAFVGFLGSQWVDRRKAERAERRRFAAAITSARNELEFYIVKLNYLSGQTSDLINSIESSSGGPVVLPSYTLYPSFLEQAKIRLAAFMRQPELVKEIGHCHFELGHVVKRLEYFQSRTPTREDDYRRNLLGFRLLVDATAREFERVRAKIDRWMEESVA